MVLRVARWSSTSEETISISGYPIAFNFELKTLGKELISIILELSVE